MSEDSPAVIISSSIHPKPQVHEVEIVWILARHFCCTVEFLQPSRGYKQKTPDVVMNQIKIESTKHRTGKVLLVNKEGGVLDLSDIR